MRGMPVTRASSPDGRFAYTLYDGAGRHPFVHALDTVGRTARCIDLHGLTGYEFLSEVQLDVSPGGGTLSVMPPRGTSALFLIDTRTDEVTEPAAPDTSAWPQEPDGAGSCPQRRAQRRSLAPHGGRRGRSPSSPDRRPAAPEAPVPAVLRPSPSTCR